MKTTKALLAVIPALALAGTVFLGTGLASAAPTTTGPSAHGHYDLTGAFNMTHVNASSLHFDANGNPTSGMWFAMSVNNPLGDYGMCLAVLNTYMDVCGLQS